MMSGPIEMLSFALPEAGGGLRQPAGRDAVARFEQLLDAPPASATEATPTSSVAAAELPSGPTASDSIRRYAEDVSVRWEAGRQAILDAVHSKHMSSEQLLALQYETVNRTLSLELVTKSAGMVESGAQTLIQRS